MSSATTTIVLQEILERYLNGDGDAKGALIELAYSRLMVIARGLLTRFPSLRREEETAAVVNMAYNKISRALEDVRPATVRIFFGLAALQIRRNLLDLVRQYRASIELGERDPKQSGDEQAIWHRWSDVMDAIDKLSEEDQELVNQLFFMGRTQAEVAELIGVHPDTVKRRWAKIRIKLAGLLDTYADVVK